MSFADLKCHCHVSVVFLILLSRQQSSYHTLQPHTLQMLQAGSTKQAAHEPEHDIRKIHSECVFMCVRMNFVGYLPHCRKYARRLPQK
ncbi:hypothetical protein HanIR_Chr17g0858081 [Helianthus annuus]|nr:hypothetical protein HanIR_Chr17g0858081 [Helianthus annuus]